MFEGDEIRRGAGGWKKPMLAPNYRLQLQPLQPREDRKLPGSLRDCYSYNCLC